MKTILDYLAQHPGIIAAVSASITWLTNNGLTRVISSLPAPTKNSTPKYIFWFQLLNNLVGNKERAENTRIENSPNWQDAAKIAIDKHLEQNGQPAQPPQQ